MSDYSYFTKISLVDILMDLLRRRLNSKNVSGHEHCSTKGTIKRIQTETNTHTHKYIYTLLSV